MTHAPRWETYQNDEVPAFTKYPLEQPVYIVHEDEASQRLNQVLEVLNVVSRPSYVHSVSAMAHQRVVTPLA